MGRRILIVAAHPDDEVLGCGGIIARLSREKNDIFVSILGEGITSRYAQREQANGNSIDELNEKSKKVACFLGAKDVSFFKMPDNRFDTIPFVEIVEIIEELIGRIRPNIIYTHHIGDLNIDHEAVHRAVMAATHFQNGSFLKSIYSFEVPSSTEWAFDRPQRPFLPNTFVDITQTLEDKIRAMEIYDSESRPFPHPRSSEALRIIARHWGSVMGCDAAEAFELIRSLR